VFRVVADVLVAWLPPTAAAPAPEEELIELVELALG
jgi:hypothetical protein